MQITKDMNIGQVVAMNVELAPILAECGMHCFGCPLSQMETLEAACMGHGVDADALVARLNAKLAELEQAK